MATTGSRGLASTPNRVLGYVFGAVYVLVGLLGFTVSGGHDFAGMDGGKLLGLFMVNPLHNIAHLLIGAALIGAARAGEKLAAGMNTTIGAVYLLLGLVGLFVLTNSVNILALNSADNGLHLVSAVLLLAVGLGARRLGSRTARA